MSILDVTEDQIFQTLGRGKDPNFKPIEKVRPAIPRPKKTPDADKTTADKIIKPSQIQIIKAKEESVRPVPLPVTDASMKRLEEGLYELNNRIYGLQKMVKWCILPQFAVILILLLALYIRS